MRWAACAGERCPLASPSAQSAFFSYLNLPPYDPPTGGTVGGVEREGDDIQNAGYVPSWRRRLPLGVLQSIAGDHASIPAAAVLDRARLRGIVNMNDAKARSITVRPLEVIHQGPYEKASNVDP